MVRVRVMIRIRELSARLVSANWFHTLIYTTFRSHRRTPVAIDHFHQW